MTDFKPAPTCTPPVRHATRLALLLIGGLLQGCAQNAAQPTAGARVYQADVLGEAKQCDAPKLDPAAGKTTEAVVKMSNSGWCGLPVHQPGPKPYEAGLLTARPSHGTVLVHEVGDLTRIDYTPDRGYTGTDSFSVELLPGDGTIHETVTVTSP